MHRHEQVSSTIGQGGEAAASVVTPSTARRRPSDRKQQILERASELFLTRGFPSVTMEDIAEAAGVTPRALYRHYDNKSDLLTQVIMSSQEIYFAARRRADALDLERAEDRDDRPLYRELPALIDTAVATRALTVLWQREARHLPDDRRLAVRTRITTIVDGIRRNIEVELPALGRADVERRAWGVSSTLTSLGFHDLTLPGSAMRDLLTRACLAAAHSGPPGSGRGAPTPVPNPGLVADLSSRRERLLGAGAGAFARHGFLPVGITEVARRAGIAGPGIYRYFPAKQAILETLVRRLDEWRDLHHLRAVRAGDDHRSVLRHLVDGHLAISAENPDLVAVSQNETAHLTDDVRETVARNAGDRENVWVECVRALDPALSRTEARILVRAAVAIIDDTARTPRLWARDAALDDVATIAAAVLEPVRDRGDGGSR